MSSPEAPLQFDQYDPSTAETHLSPMPVQTRTDSRSDLLQVCNQAISTCVAVSLSGLFPYQAKENAMHSVTTPCITVLLTLATLCSLVCSSET